MVDRLAESGTLRKWAFVATVAHTNPIYDITLLGLVSQPARLIRRGGGGDAARGARCIVEERVVPPAASRAPGVGSESRLTASSAKAPGCTRPHPFRFILMAAARRKGAKLSPWQADS